MGGSGVWKVECAGADSVVVQHAAGGVPPETRSLDEFLASCEPYFAGSGLVVEQPYQPRLPDGLIRAYLTHDEVVGFTHQYPRGLLPPDVAPRPPTKTSSLRTLPGINLYAPGSRTNGYPRCSGSSAWTCSGFR